MKQIIFAATLVGALFIGQFANAQGRHHAHKQHHKSQRERIQDGIRNGSITKNEAMRLRMQQAKLRGYKEMARVDGRVNGKEMRLLKGEQKRANYNIYKARHNDNGRHGNMHKGGKGRYSHKGQAYQRHDSYRGGQGKGYGSRGNGDATWKFRDDNKEGFWNIR